jgi:hypothetical protein
MSPINEIGQIILGFFLLLGMHIAAIAAGSFLVAIVSTISSPLTNSLALILLYCLMGIGLSQLLYVVPIAIILSRRRQWGLMKGVIIGAVITALLNGGCWLVFYGSLK